MHDPNSAALIDVVWAALLLLAVPRIHVSVRRIRQERLAEFEEARRRV